MPYRVRTHPRAADGAGVEEGAACKYGLSALVEVDDGAAAEMRTGVRSRIVFVERDVGTGVAAAAFDVRVAVIGAALLELFITTRDQVARVRGTSDVASLGQMSLS